ncbi:MAG: hypothetical protein WCG97_03130 [bacterium]
MKNTQKGFIVPLLIISAILISGGFYLYSKSRTQVQVYNNTSQISTTSNSTVEVTSQNPETKRFRLYRKHDAYVYLVSSEYPVPVYYKSNELNVFKNYQELDYLQITANSYTKLNVPEKEFVGIKDYSVDITEQINNIINIKLISENEFNSEDAHTNELSEKFSNTPAIVKSIKSLGNNSWSLDLDILTDNPKWTPGGQEMLYINQDTKVRTLIVNNDTKNHVCADGDMEGRKMYESNTNLINWFKNLLDSYEAEYKKSGGHKGEVYYNFDISGNLITATYPRCRS